MVVRRWFHLRWPTRWKVFNFVGVFVALQLVGCTVSHCAESGARQMAYGEDQFARLQLQARDALLSSNPRQILFLYNLALDGEGPDFKKVQLVYQTGRSNGLSAAIRSAFHAIIGPDGWRGFWFWLRNFHFKKEGQDTSLVDNHLRAVDALEGTLRTTGADGAVFREINPFIPAASKGSVFTVVAKPVETGPADLSSVDGPRVAS